MSIISISTGADSKISDIDLKGFAAELGIKTLDEKDAKDYLTLLRSLESVLDSINQSPDYIPPDLLPHTTLEPRKFWRPEATDNPFNAWSHQCNIQSAAPTSNLLSNRTIAIKDNISVGGLPTTLGLPSSLFPHAKHPTSPIDAVVVSRIHSASGIIKGTSTCESLCASPFSFTSATGPVHNPHLHNHTAGGSSSGSAVLVAAHQMASAARTPGTGQTTQLAIGTDQAGSVRIPASYTGIYGLMPTSGLIPYTGAASMSPMIDHIGPLAASLEDVAALLEVMAGYDGYDPRMTPESPLSAHVKPYVALIQQTREQIHSTPKPARNLRVGIIKESCYMPGVTPAVRAVVSEAAMKYFAAAGAAGKPSGQLSFLPPHTEVQWPLSQDAYEMLTALNPATVNIMLSEVYGRNCFMAGIERKAHRLVFALRAAYDAALEEVDILVTPCAPGVAMAHPELVGGGGGGGERVSILERLGVAVGLTGNTCPFNITGHPAMNVPCGLSAAEGYAEVELPVGMQIVARRRRDEELLEVAALFEWGWELCKSAGEGFYQDL
ncbi:amidase [Aspergillus karnatakaensis]|uniref:amidase n=1 Tax=Aspergillus karnatakaensis TaxID=1810916 RepID=UPI003CCDA781